MQKGIDVTEAELTALMVPHVYMAPWRFSRRCCCCCRRAWKKDNRLGRARLES